MKNISTINPAIMEIQNARLLRCESHLPIKIVGVSLNHGVSLRFVSSYFKHFVS